MLISSETVLNCHKFCQIVVFDYFHRGTHLIAISKNSFHFFFFFCFKWIWVFKEKKNCYWFFTQKVFSFLYFITVFKLDISKKKLYSEHFFVVNYKHKFSEQFLKIPSKTDSSWSLGGSSIKIPDSVRRRNVGHRVKRRGQ